ncbi:MAG TPA: methyltransferase [Candidatus Kapabacteria bacterium]|nr:methyltransferase [Candidatus Kapabacteria bacterium]
MQKNIQMSHKANTIDFILDISYAFQRSRVLLTACEFEIFSIIGERGLSSESIAHKIDTDKTATDRLLNALCGLELLTKKEGIFYNTPISMKHLVHGSNEFLGNLEYIASTWDVWSNLSQTIKTGKSLNNISINKQTAKWINNYSAAAFWRANVEANDIIRLIKNSGAKKILDLGGGMGAYSRALSEQNPNAEVVLYEIPIVATQAKANISEWKLEDKIKVVEGNFQSDDIGKGYDIIFISRVLQHYSIWENVKLLQKCFDATNFGGHIVINETILDSDRTSPMQHVMWSLSLLLNSNGGDTYTETDLWIMLREAWYRNIVKVKTPFDTTLMIGER